MQQISNAKPERSIARVLRNSGWGILRQQGPLIVFALFFIFCSIYYNGFFSAFQLGTFFSSNAIFALLAIGETFVIMTGGIDISIGSLAALCAVVAAQMSNYGLFPALLAVIVVGAVAGLINGWGVSYLRMPPFIVTLATQLGLRGLALVVSNAATVSANSNNDFPNIYMGNVLGLPVPAWMLIIVFIIASVVLNYTRFGRHVLAVGGNEEATRLLGLRVERTKIMVYVINGILAGLAGLLLAAQTFSGNPNEAIGWELNAIAAVIVGGTLITGGKGSVFGSVVGALLLGLILTALNFESSIINISSYWQAVIRGIFLFVVILLQVRLARQKKMQLENRTL